MNITHILRSAAKAYTILEHTFHRLDCFKITAAFFKCYRSKTVTFPKHICRCSHPAHIKCRYVKTCYIITFVKHRTHISNSISIKISKHQVFKLSVSLEQFAHITPVSKSAFAQIQSLYISFTCCDY